VPGQVEGGPDLDNLLHAGGGDEAPLVVVPGSTRAVLYVLDDEAHVYWQPTHFFFNFELFVNS
jgi:hypothetical protein